MFLILLESLLFVLILSIFGSWCCIRLEKNYLNEMNVNCIFVI